MSFYNFNIFIRQSTAVSKNDDANVRRIYEQSQHKF